jgi:H/ACA ribonucleoprotein complex subunit 4
MKSLFQYGVINLDKVSGPTSHEVVSWVRKILGISASGHGGTLDPGVTGVLPCAIGKATRVLSALLSAGKEYVGVLYLHTKEPQERIENIFQIFTSKLYQRPPLKSSVVRKLRVREVYYSKVLEVNDHHVLFRIGSEAGFYVRKFCFDVGEALCSGGHMLELRRTRVGHFNEDDSLFKLQDIKDAYTIYQSNGDESYLQKIIFPMEKMVAHMPKIFVRDTAVDALCHGADLATHGCVNIDARIKPGTQIAYMTLKKELIGFGTANQDAMTILKAKKGIVSKTNKVFYPRGVYPRWASKNTKNDK